MPKTICVIICTRNRYDDLRATLDSLKRQERLPDELIIVDSSDMEKGKEILNLANLPFESKYVRSNAGLTLQRNVGIRESKGDLICFFDDDVDLDVTYLKEIETVFINDAHKKIGAVGGRIKNVPGYDKNTFRAHFDRFVFGLIRSVFGLGDFGSGNYKLSGMPTFPHRQLKAKQCETLTGCCMAFRREVFSKIEFDENLPGYGLMEDVDISKRVLDIGYQVYYEPAAALIHKVSSQNRLDYFRWGEMSVVNYAYLFRKNWSQDYYRWLFYYWALIGLVVLNLHNRDALSGTLQGLKKLRSF